MLSNCSLLVQKGPPNPANANFILDLSSLRNKLIYFAAFINANLNILNIQTVGI